MLKHWFGWLVVLSTVACAGTGKPPLPSATSKVEERLGAIRQMTFGGENAEAYWSFSGDQLSFQARAPNEGCDRIYRMGLSSPPVRVSNGEGATTCAHFFPGDQSLVFASTQSAGATCPPKPDMSQGYVWALHPSYELYTVDADGGNLRQLTNSPGYDAEATVCGKDGSILFTSVRDGDLELYRMDKDGSNVRRLTSTPGYDGGAFFNHDCTRIVWRASRPKPGKELDEYRALLQKNLVRPTRLELYTADADGTHPVQVTYLNAASFAPFFFPDGKRIAFSSNFQDKRGREFDIYAVDVAGTNLERVTQTPGFDGFPMFRPDGTKLAFSSNRATAPGASDTNIFVADWNSAAKPLLISQPADQIMKDVAFLAAPEQEGRGIGTQGLQRAANELVRRFQELGLEPAATADSFRQPFEVTSMIERSEGTQLEIEGQPVPETDFTPLGFSANAEVRGELRWVGYGIYAPTLKHDDYAGVDVRGKIVVVRRFAPETPDFQKPENRRYAELRYKTWTARERGAAGVLIVDMALPPTPLTKEWQPGPEASLPALNSDSHGDAGIPVMGLKRQAVQAVWPKLSKHQSVRGRMAVALKATQEKADNLIGRLKSKAPAAARLPGMIVVGAHYDHLGFGGSYSLAPGTHLPHLGADDNASGVAGMLEIARLLSQRADALGRDILFIAFSAEEMGILGSSHFVRQLPPGLSLKDIYAMVNLDMVGRMRANTVTVLGADSALEWKDLVGSACAEARIECNASGNGYGPSDQTPFFAAGVPVIHFFTGAHSDYHKPTDSADRINASGLAQIAAAAANVVQAISAKRDALQFQNLPSPPSQGDMRSFSASLGTIPDYSGPPPGQSGVLLAGVRPGGAADKAGIQRGDLLVRLAGKTVTSIEDFMFVLNTLKPDQTVPVEVVREGKRVTLQATLQRSTR